jgi:Domain of unknown function (DUF4160)
MPTVMVLDGWRACFYSNETDSQMHVHVIKADSECKFWLYPDQYVIEEDYEHNLQPRLRREIRRLLYRHFDEIVAAWRQQFG